MRQHCAAVRLNTERYSEIIVRVCPAATLLLVIDIWSWHYAFHDEIECCCRPVAWVRRFVINAPRGNLACFVQATLTKHTYLVRRTVGISGANTGHSYRVCLPWGKKSV